MKPLMLHGHERAITTIKYNREGDLLFSSAKDKEPNVWYSLNGERLGTFVGHEGAVWSIDVNWDTTKFLSGAADNKLLLWDCKTGKVIGRISTNSAVRTCQFSYSGNMACYSTASQGGHPCELFVIDVRTPDIMEGNSIWRMTFEDPKITSLLWGSVDDTIITGHDNGELQQWDMRNGKMIASTRDHMASINDMQMNKDSTLFITASKDNTAKLFDSETLFCLKTYKTERPVNSAAISPILDHVVLGGGQDAMEVTTTSTRIGKFDSRFFHLVFEEEFARVKGHFGPINSVAFHPDGRSYSSGGEDGYIRHGNSPVPRMETWLEMDQGDGFVDRDLTSSLTGAESFGSAHKNYQNALIRTKQTEGEDNSAEEEVGTFAGAAFGRNQRKASPNENLNEYLNTRYRKYSSDGGRSYDMHDNKGLSEENKYKSPATVSELRKLRSQRYNDPMTTFHQNFGDEIETKDRSSLCQDLNSFNQKNHELPVTGNVNSFLVANEDKLKLNEYDVKDLEIAQSDMRDPVMEVEDERSLNDNAEYLDYKSPAVSRDVDYGEVNPHGIIYKREELKTKEAKSKIFDEDQKTQQSHNAQSVKASRSGIILEAESPKEGHEIAKHGTRAMRRNIDTWKLNGKLNSKELNDVMRDSQRALEEVQVFQQKLGSKPQYNYLNSNMKRELTSGFKKRYMDDGMRDKREDEDEQKNMKTGTDEGGGEYEDEEGKGHNDEEEYYEEAELIPVQSSDDYNQKFQKREIGKDKHRKAAKYKSENLVPSMEDYELNLENAPVENEENSKNSVSIQGESGTKKISRKGAKIWDQWGEWSPCSVTCGVGRSIRWRHCIGGGCARGEKEAQIKKCTKPAC